jgi:predicted amidophosphoribosyltransferase
MTIAETEAETPGPRRSIGSLFGKLGRFVVDVILPPTCLACRMPVGEGGGLCPQRWIGAGFIERPYCERLGTPFPSDYGGPLISPATLAEPPAYGRARAVARYGDVVRDLTHMLKYGDRLDLVHALARWMTRAGAELLADADVLVPVPLHWTRLWQRRFNHRPHLLVPYPNFPACRPPIICSRVRGRRRRNSVLRARSAPATCKAPSKCRRRPVSK